MLKKTALIVGCSLTAGYKLGPEKNGTQSDLPTHPDIWANRLIKSLGDFEITNLASSGANNETIFHVATENILSQKYDLVLVQWTELPRLNLQVGLELYHTRSMLNYDWDINLNNHVVISGKWLSNIGERIRWISNPHWQILNLVRYVNILKNLQNLLYGGKILFVNGIVDLPKDYFTPMPYRYPDELPEYVQKMLQVETRDDSEIRELYEKIHEQYKSNQGINPDLWLNLYQPLKHIQVDNIHAGDTHPGPKSQIIFSDYLKEKLIEKIT